MAVATRTSRALQQALGDEPAEDVINWMHSMEADTTRISDRIELQFGQAAAQVDLKFHNAASQMDLKFQHAATQMDFRFQQADARLDARFAEFHRIISTEISARFNDLLKWSFVFWAGAVGAIAALGGMFR